MRVYLTALLLLSLPASGRAADAGLPIFDAHIHYSEPAWAELTPEAALEALERAGVRRALVSSTPDDGTLRLYEKATARIVPFLRPYRTRADMGRWHEDPAVQAYVEARLARGVYRGIGEFHLYGAEAEGPVVKRFAQLAVERDLFLYAHTDDATIERMLRLYPGARILWAHAGMSATPASIARLLAQSPRLRVELSLRSDVAPAGTLDPEWRALFLRYPDRFLIGTDTFVNERWHGLADWIRGVQQWLSQLPRNVAEQIAFGNGDRLFPPQ